MHPRNIYNTPPDFSDLAIRYPEFLKISKLYINGKVKIDWMDHNAIRILSKCLLHKDFGLNVDIPSNRLVPTIPLRLNYLLWLEDLLEAANVKNSVYGIDIGTGACCIYPLLAVVKFNWKMMATEINENSVNMAYKNVRQNNLEKSITVKKVDDSNKLLIHCFKEYGGTLDRADFCMCNPPFYASAEDMDISRTLTRETPNNARTGTIQEIITDGGEVEFVKKLFKESQLLKHKVKIFTTMLGHKSSLKPLMKIIRDSGVSQICHTNFVQGKTMRWGLAWSFIESTNLSNTQSNTKAKPKNKCMAFVIPKLEGLEYKVKDVSLKLMQILKKIELVFKIVQSKEIICTMEVKAAKNTWSHQRRKRREQKQVEVDRKEENVEILNTDVPSTSHNHNTFQYDKSNLKRKCIDDTNSTKKVKYDDNTSVSSKETNGNKSNDNSEECEGNSSNCEDFLTMALCVRIDGAADGIVLEVGYVSGSGGKDAVHQIVQYIKNNWK